MEGWKIGLIIFGIICLAVAAYAVVNKEEAAPLVTLDSKTPASGSSAKTTSSAVSSADTGSSTPSAPTTGIWKASD